MENGWVLGTPRWILRLEGLVVLGAAALAYAELGGNWWIFAALFLVPDLSMLGYLNDARVGAIAYNIGHSYLAPIAMLAAGLTLTPQLLPIAIIWIAHIGFDRALGYGLKYGNGFGVTHLGLIGKARQAAKSAEAASA